MSKTGKPWRISWKARTFSLIELLVVVSIISILAALLLPVLARAREYGHWTVCRNNMRQNGVAFHLYSDDYNDWFPVSYVTDNFYGYFVRFRGYYQDEWCRQNSFSSLSSIRTYNRPGPTMLAPQYTEPETFTCPKVYNERVKKNVDYVLWRSLAAFLDAGTYTASQWKAKTGVNVAWPGNRTTGYYMPTPYSKVMVSGGIPRWIGARRPQDPPELTLLADMGWTRENPGTGAEQSYGGIYKDYNGSLKLFLAARHLGRQDFLRNDGAVYDAKVVGVTDFSEMHISRDNHGNYHVSYVGDKDILRNLDLENR
ncbi:MAG: prepilin-type N-terminal cleavage/methylation domain-containing protein [Lentisphaerae bacterium]|nr:MAG: prepilin-type N-terminal cleavage/methylation domain-containing protein [Lentisphaerota bacterium]